MKRQAETLFLRMELLDGSVIFKIKVSRVSGIRAVSNACKWCRKTYGGYRTITGTWLYDRILGGLRRGETWHMDCHVWSPVIVRRDNEN